MLIVLIIVGAVVGSLVSGGGASQPLGMLTGAAIGALFARLISLQSRVKEIERKAALKDAPIAPPQTAESGEWDRVETPEAGPVTAATDPASAAPIAPGLSEPAPERAPSAPVPREPGLLHQGLHKARDWLITGNVPVKVGVIVSFVGVAFLLKYAVDRELIFIPLELRLLLVAGAGAALAMLGWRLRQRMRVYALSLQGGGLGIIFLTVFAALRIWQLLPPTLGFFLLVALALVTGVLSVLQNARALAVLGIVGGFLAPILASTGAGSHVILFSYYLVLNLGILFIAWFRAWRELNLLGFFFTFVIGSLWGYQYYRPAHFATTEPFLVVHFFLYQAVAILFALRAPAPNRGFVDATLVFGTPVVCFALQAGLLRDTEYGLAISAVVAALFYAVGASSLYRKHGPRVRLLVEAYLALAAVFFIIAVPLALDARWTSAAWALQGAALVWLGVRQTRKLAALGGTGLILFSGAAFMLDGWSGQGSLPVLNANLLGGALISLSALFASRRLDSRAGAALGRRFPAASVVLFAWGALWWFGSGYAELEFHVAAFARVLNGFTLFFATSMLLAMWLGNRLAWDKARILTAFQLPGLLYLLNEGYQRNEHFLLDLGWLAWPVAWASQALVLRNFDRHGGRLAALWHLLALLVITGALALEAKWQVARWLAPAWGLATAASVPGLVAWLIWRCREWPPWPVPEHPRVYFGASLLLVSGQVLALCALALEGSGDPTPLPWLVLLNPYDLAWLLAAVVAIGSLRILPDQLSERGLLFDTVEPAAYRALLAVGFFLLTTASWVRAVHHLTGVPWMYDSLYESVLVQTSLSIWWGLLGFAGMIWGAKSKRRRAWLAGAGFMALVVIKLFAVDLGNTGTVARIVSFIGIGALLLVVGYLAPAPPRK